MKIKGVPDQEILSHVETYPDVSHPLFTKNMHNKRRALYVSELCLTRIAGITDGESAAILQSTFDLAFQRNNAYVHRWSIGDVLIWDNSSLMHRGALTGSRDPRIMHRTTTIFDRSFFGDHFY